MAKTYSQPTPGKKANNMNPKLETIQFLLSYSKALSVIPYKSMKFEALLN
ncbi:MAG: hypothetical protein ABNH00_08225 [Dokdonia sp.]